MAFSLLQHKVAAVANVNTPLADFTNVNLIVEVQAYIAGFPGTITDTFSNSYTARTIYSITGNSAVRSSYSSNPTVSNSFQGHTNAGFPCIGLIGVSGAKSSSPFDTEDGNTNNSGVTSINAGATGVTPSENNCLIVSVIALDGSFSSLAIGSGFTLLDTIAYSASNNYGFGMAYLIQGAAAAINPQWSWTTTRKPASGLYVFKSDGIGGFGSFPAALIAA